jgi:hypothetical protein
MLQASILNVSSVFSDVCCKCAYSDVCFTYMLQQSYVAITVFSDVCCKCAKLAVLGSLAPCSLLLGCFLLATSVNRTATRLQEEQQLHVFIMLLRSCIALLPFASSSSPAQSETKERNETDQWSK